jgi:hypothetical protein
MLSTLHLESQPSEASPARNHELCSAECFHTFICSTPLPKGIKLSEGIAKLNGQQDPRIWLNDFLTAVTISGGSKDNAR